MSAGIDTVGAMGVRIVLAAPAAMVCDSVGVLLRA